MRYMIINGEKKKIPPFPHHKYYVYCSRKFFLARSILDHMTMNRFITIKELINGWRYKTFIPRVLLIDPTSSCNLKCKGCWASDYSKQDHLSYEKLDDIVTQARKIGIGDILMTGGEPLMRKKDIIRLCEKHRKTTFAAFTNATMIDEEFADEMVRLGNLNMFLLIEGTKEETDFIRGPGVYDKVINAMDILKSRDIGFAFSTCYHSKNYKTIASDEFLDYMREKGCWFGWLFNYVPVGSDADLELACSADQRAYVQQKISEYCRKHQYTIVDFWNNGHLAFGCLAAGNGFIHINSKGDVEPCAFCHYSDSNIHETSLLDALKSPFFTAFRKAQPFSSNPLRACPMVDVPEKIIKVVKEGNAHSTHYNCPESAQTLADKNMYRAEQWKIKADELFKKMPLYNQKNFPIFLKYHSFKKRLSDERRNQRDV